MSLPPLEDAGFERRTKGRDYVTARDPESGKQWRLKGSVVWIHRSFLTYSLARAANSGATHRGGLRWILV